MLEGRKADAEDKELNLQFGDENQARKVTCSFVNAELSDFRCICNHPTIVSVIDILPRQPCFSAVTVDDIVVDGNKGI